MRAFPPIALLLLMASPVLGADGAADTASTAPALSQAQMREDLLDSLFARLRMAHSGREAKLAEDAIWKMWMSSDSPSAEAMLTQATKAMGAEQNDAALLILGNLVSLQPQFAEAWNKRATLYFTMHQYAQSLADIDKVLDLEPRHFGALAGLGMIKLQQGDLPGALSAYKRALSINPNMPGVKHAIEEIESQQRPI
jgi:tetratricopeptide (TPR) repeat protein